MSKKKNSTVAPRKMPLRGRDQALRFPLDQSLAGDGFLSEAQRRAVPYYFADTIMRQHMIVSDPAFLDRRDFSELYGRIHGLCRFFYSLAAQNPREFRRFVRGVHQRASELCAR